jgi:hypothetical protein
MSSRRHRNLKPHTANVAQVQTAPVVAQPAITRARGGRTGGTLPPLPAGANYRPIPPSGPMPYGPGAAQ